MNKQRIVKAVVLLIAGLWVTAASATVEIKFITPEEFSDVRDSGFGHSETLKGIEAHLQALAAAQFGAAAPGKNLLIEVIDIDRAGQLEPWGREMQEIRVLRTVGSPSIKLRYAVSEGGREVRRGEARLVDLSYLDRLNRYSSGDPIRYEKRMLDDWFGKEFAAAPVVAAKQP